MAQYSPRKLQVSRKLTYVRRTSRSFMQYALFVRHHITTFARPNLNMALLLQILEWKPVNLQYRKQHMLWVLASRWTGPAHGVAPGRRTTTKTIGNNYTCKLSWTNNSQNIYSQCFCLFCCVFSRAYLATLEFDIYGNLRKPSWGCFCLFATICLNSFKVAITQLHWSIVPSGGAWAAMSKPSRRKRFKINPFPHVAYKHELAELVTNTCEIVQTWNGQNVTYDLRFVVTLPHCWGFVHIAKTCIVQLFPVCPPLKVWGWALPDNAESCLYYHTDRTDMT